MYSRKEEDVMQLAPIGISTYGRLNHLKQTIEALQRNTLAKQSELYIFSDAPRVGDEEIVANVRAYINTLSDGFKKVYVIERDTNGIIENNRGGIKQLLAEYGKMIFLEDDNITSPYFLEYMNNALEFYKEDDRISSISGYCPPMKIPIDYKKDIFVLHRLSPWGMAFWKESYEKYFKYIDKQIFTNFLKDEKLVNQLIEDSGREALEIIKMEVDGRIDAGDMKMIFWQNFYKVFTVYPRETLVKNIGQDGSGALMGETDKWDTVLGSQNKFTFIENIQPDVLIRKVHSEFYCMPKERYLFLKKIGIFKYIYPIYKILKAYRIKILGLE